MKKIVTILGARPQFVKAAVLSRIIIERNEIDEVIVHTGQHFDRNMSEVFFGEMAIPAPKYNLDINSLSHGAMTGRMLEGIEKILLDENPQLVVVYGDTNSTLAGSLAAKKLNIPVAHVEAGLRSFNQLMPEETNRILTDRISDLLLCPTQSAVKNLKSEGFPFHSSKVVLCGDIMKDAVHYYGKLSHKRSRIIENLDLKKESFVLATIHREENTGDQARLKSIFIGLDQISNTSQVIMPLHPRTKAALKRLNVQSRVKFIDPVGYFDMLELLKNCSLVITDSGGLQKEAYFCEKPCLIAREETEWVELVAHGYAKICGNDAAALLDAFSAYMGKTPDFSESLFGDEVGVCIYKEISDFLNLKP